jgi:hypothetical protein
MTDRLGTALINLNGRPVSAAWTQWQSPTGPRIAISDAALVQLLGLQLLSTADSSRQPVAWFSSGPIATLPVRLIGPVRYLDITDLAKQAGWYLQPSGTTLTLATLATKVTGVRLGKQPWGDRLVVDLNQPTPVQVESQAQELVVTLDAQLDPALLTSFQSIPGNRVQSVRLEAASNRTTLRLTIPISQYPQVTTLAGPNRLVIDYGNPEGPSRDLLWAPGLRWRQDTVGLGGDRFPINWFEVNLRQPGLSIQPLLPATGAAPGAAGTSTLFSTAKAAQAVAAVNGGFFNRNEQLPLGAVRINGQWRAGPILNRGVVAWNPGGDWRFERLATQEAIIVAGQRQPLTTLNSAYVQAGIARYTADWGPTYTPMSDNEVVMTVQTGQVIAQQTLGAALGSSPVAIPSGGYLLVFRRNQTLANAMPVGTALQLESTLLPDLSRYQSIIGGGPLLVQNRQIVVNGKGEQFSDAFVNERAARSAIGRTADGTVLIVAVHDRVGGKGPSLEEMAQLMAQLGCVDAVNMDGGSSTTLYLGGQILDRPARSSARVHNAIGIFLQP